MMLLAVAALTEWRMPETQWYLYFGVCGLMCVQLVSNAKEAI